MAEANGMLAALMIQNVDLKSLPHFGDNDDIVDFLERLELSLKWSECRPKSLFY